MEKFKRLLFTSIFSVYTLIFCASCIEISFEKQQREVDYLLEQYGGNYITQGYVSLPSRYSSSSSDETTYEKFYSSNLDSYVIVKKSVYQDDFFTESIYFSSNYPYVKYKTQIEENLISYISPDFPNSQIKCFFDVDWHFTNSSESNYSSQSNFIESLASDFSYSWNKDIIFVLIDLSSDEQTDLETRLKSATYNIYKNYPSYKINFYITKSSQINFSTLTYENLYSDTELYKKFDEHYQKESSTLTKLSEE